MPVNQEEKKLYNNKVIDHKNRVGVFIDAPNFSKHLRQKHNIEANPLLLANKLCGNDRELTYVSYHTGIINEKDTTVYNIKSKNIHDKKVDFLREAGVVVYQHPLILNKQGEINEKNIKIKLTLDVVENIISGKIDTAIIVSQDVDLISIVETIENLGANNIINNKKIEGAIILDVNQQKIKPIYNKYSKLHLLKDKDFFDDITDNLVYDDNNFNAFANNWHNSYKDLEEKLLVNQ